MAALKKFRSHKTQFNRVYVNIYQISYQIISKPLIDNLMLKQCEVYIYIYIYIYIMANLE